MFEKPDWLLDVYGPLLRAVFFIGHGLRKVCGLGRRFTPRRRALVGPPPAPGGGPISDGNAGADVPVNVNRILEMISGPRGCPGIAAVALRGDRVIAQGVAGLRKRGGPELIAPGDQFHLGSCGKATTATVAAILIEEGKLDWTATLDELFAGAVVNIHSAWRNVTLQQVLDHRAGLVRDTSPKLRTRMVSSTRPLPQQRREIVATVLARPPTHRPGRKLVYSNTGYMLVGAALEKISGLDWPDLLRERLFQPLGITTGGFGVPGSPGKVDQPWGHFPITGKPVDPGDPAAEAPLFDIPAGLLHMSITDWAKFITLHLRGDAANPHRQTKLLKPGTFAKLHSAEPGQSYRSGWSLETRDWAKGAQPGAMGRVLCHGGTNFRWHSFVWVAPEIDFAVLVACNRGMDFISWSACQQAGGMLIAEFASKP